MKCFLLVLLFFSLSGHADECENNLTEFKISGKNSQEVLRSLKTLNDVPLEVIEATMRPGVRRIEGSQGGFLGADESLIEVLLDDNHLVVEELGLTHLQLAQPLEYAVEKYYEDANASQFEYGGQEFTFEVTQTHGVQFSPFFDQTGGSFTMKIRNLKTGQELTFAALVPTMIKKYGFYEGPQSPYRVDPLKIVQVFELHRHL